TWTASSALPSGTYLLQVSQTVIDLAGNALAFPYSRVFSDAAEESFFSGTVIDEVTGRPLSGARVVVTATGGEATAEPRPEQTTGADGRFLIAVPAGTHGVTVARPGYTPVFRIVTTVEGLGTEVFDPRLTPASEARAVTAAAGGTVEVEGASLDVPAQALAADASVTLTAVGEQGLAALLPYGWTPRGAVWLDVEEELTSPATLSFAVESPNGATLTVAKLDVATLQWRSVDDVLVVVGEVTVTVSTFGAYAAVEPDTGALEPPPAVVGEVLGSSPAPEGGEVTAAAVSFEPAIVTPDQTADATAVYTLASEVASGLPLTMVIREELELLDGTIRRFAPFRADVVLYRALDGTPRSRFRLRPSTAARTTPIRGGGLELRVVPYGDESVRGNVLGPEGGTVVGDAGDRLAVAAGALTTPTAVTLTRRTVAELPLSAPAGGTVDGVVEVDLGGAELAVPGALTLSMGTPPSAGEVGLLLLVVDAGGTPRYRAVAELAPSASGWTTRAIVAADLPWPGVTTGGHYVFLRLSVPLAFVRGTAYRVDGTPLAGGIVEAAGVDWIQITGADGRYVLPVPVGEATTIAITNPATGNAVASTVTAAAGNERIDLDPRLLIVGPSVVETSPIGGAVAPAGVEPTVRFSEPVDPASLAAGITLVHGTETVAVSFDAQGSLVTVLPAATLAPGGAYELRIGMEVRDLQGYALAYPVSVGFAIQVPALPSEIDLTKVFLVEPDGSGTAQVLGHPGAVPANTLVWVENLTSYSTTESTTSAANGSFALTIGAALTDQLLFHVLVQGGNEVISLLGPYMTADLKGAWAGPEGTSFVTVEGVAVTVEEGTFTALARVRAQLRPAAEPSIEMPE
ncbi:MAG TPA: Ig-like domain-containing protein, partial [Thermoanaerobaculia bacterium]